MHQISGIYKIINKINEKYYVGGTVDLYGGAGRLGRLRRHKRDLNNGNHFNKHLQRAWNKYGATNFDFIIIIENVDRLKVIKTEQKYLDVAKTEKNKCYNSMFSASICNQIDSPDWRKRLSDSLKGRKFSKSHKKHISDARKGIGIDPTIFGWRNKKTGELFTGTMFDWYTKYGFRYKFAGELKSGVRKSYHGWEFTDGHRN